MRGVAAPHPIRQWFGLLKYIVNLEYKLNTHLFHFRWNRVYVKTER